VRVDDDLYVRAYRGRTSSWFRRVQRAHDGPIRAGGVDTDSRQHAVGIDRYSRVVGDDAIRFEKRVGGGQTESAIWINFSSPDSVRREGIR